MEPSTVNALPERELNSTALLTVALVLAAVTMTFGALITVFFVRSEGREFWGHLHVPVTLWITTLILLASSVPMERARRAVYEGNRTIAYREFRLNFGMGLLFLLGQVVAWFQVLSSGVSLKNNPHSWFIFLFAAMHGLHILVGLAGVGVLAYRTHEPVSGRKYQARTRAIALGVSIFWHFLGFLWVVLFALLLLWKP